MQSGRLVIRDFAQISEASIAFRDLTVLVGAQGTGKSLVLQWLKAAIDGKYIVKTLREAGQEVSRKTLIDLIFGVGMRSAWRDSSQVTLDGRDVSPATIEKRGDGVEKLFFIPAHRSMLISDGWATPFQKLTSETPVVARLFSQNLFERFNAREGVRLFPLDRVLKRVYRDLVNDAVFHGGTVGVEQNEQLAKRLRLRFDAQGDRETSLPFMTWTAGQREFTPLLLGLYQLLTPRKQSKDPNIDWVVIEEPEMGLHPKAVTVVMLLVLDLLWRGYRVVLSTHSPIVVTAIWALQRLTATAAPYQLVCDAFSVPTAYRKSLYAVASTALTKSFATYLLQYDGDRAAAIDISSLDPGADDDAVSGWGGLAGFSSSFADAVRRAANHVPVRAT
jgi:hypothetical protein